MASVHIIYGFTEGKWHGKLFRRTLKRRGYTVAYKAQDADVVMAHSGGCFDVPQLRDNQLLLLINPPYWPERSLAERSSNMVRQIVRSLLFNRKAHFHLNKTLHNGLYLLRNRQTNQFMAARAKTFNLEQEIRHNKTILVRNHDDPWLTPELHNLQKLNSRLVIKRLPGIHDDCWLNPEPYIDIIEAART